MALADVSRSDEAPAGDSTVAKEVWRDILEGVEQAMAEDPEAFATWFKPLRVHSLETGCLGGDRLLILAPNTHFVNALEQSYRPLVNRVVVDISSDLRVLFLDSEELSKGKRAKESPRFTGLDEGLTFTTFVTGSCNAAARREAEQIAAGKGKSRVSLLYGDPGTGKTMLLNAIGNAALVLRPKAVVLYLTAVEFVRLFTSCFDSRPNDDRSSVSKRTQAFRDWLRAVDLLLIDEVQFLPGKGTRSQEEFAHLIDVLFMAGKYVVCTADRPARRLDLNEKLASRLQLNAVHLLPLDRYTRGTLLRRYMAKEEVQCPGMVLDYLATRLRGDARTVEGAARSLARDAYRASVTDEGAPLLVGLRVVSRTRAMRVLTEEGHTRDKALRVDDILAAVAEEFDLSVLILKTSTERDHELARSVAMYLLLTLMFLSFEEIGTHLPDTKLAVNRRASTVKRRCSEVQRRCLVDRAFGARVEGLGFDLTS